MSSLGHEADNGFPKVEVFTVDSSSSCMPSIYCPPNFVVLAPKKKGAKVALPKKTPKEKPAPKAAATPAPAPNAYPDPGQYPPGTYNYYQPPVSSYDQTNPYGSYAPYQASFPQLYYETAAAVVQTKKPEKVHHTPNRKAGGQEWHDPTLTEWAKGNEVSDESLRRAFSQYKSISRARVLRDKKTGKSRGYGFVSFLQPGDYIKALKEMQGKYICNRPCKLSKSRWKDRNLDDK